MTPRLTPAGYSQTKLKLAELEKRLADVEKRTDLSPRHATEVRRSYAGRADKVPFRVIIVFWEIWVISLSSPSLLADAQAPADSIADRAFRPFFEPVARSRGTVASDRRADRLLLLVGGQLYKTSKQVMEVHVGGQVIRTTAEHAF